ncbi:52 kDa repressor of the inhibitor of the protein kinase [Holothuria leucospilota]|uniref:52 kDa repressor of the inhibitor of the protein kinase n=1 Tax=Holothuria leucospilota TaxID=206669 RepID=A0A9Q1BAC7_HOLLE|nr:52 kDa repressor of the inhibitor of the protein kinase [Holothuria leucospilota]
MVGQGYDGAAAMSGHKNGVQKHIQDECPSAVYTHCVSHSLNLCLMKAGEVPDINKAVTLMHEIAVFYNDSNKRLLNLESAIKQECSQSSHARLKLHCTTRWGERQEAVRIFKELMPAIKTSLADIGLWPGCLGKASLFSSALDDSGFLVALEVLTAVLEVTKPLSVKLQAVSQDIHNAMKSVQDCVTVLQQMRTEEKFFHDLFIRAEEENGDNIQKPRTARRQRHRENHPADTPEEFYRRSVFLILMFA